MTSIEAVSDEPEAWFKLDRDGRTLAVGGAWTIAESARLDRELHDLKTGGAVEIDASKITRLDSAGAWLLLRTRRALNGEEGGSAAGALKVPEQYAPLLENLDQPRKAEPRKGPRIPRGFRGRLYKIGRAATHAYTQAVSMLGYLGRVTVETGEAIAS
ncbi:MAG TPA: STAS domain-containing protein, partial [Rhizomicrobium sp.]